MIYCPANSNKSQTIQSVCKIEKMSHANKHAAERTERSVLEFEDLSLYLKAILFERQLRNPSYSLRAFSRHLGVSVSHVSQVFAGKKKLSEKAAQGMADKLQFTTLERQYFLLLASIALLEPDAPGAALLRDKAHSIRKTARETHSDTDLARKMRTWLHYAVFAAGRTRTVELNARDLSEYFSVDPSAVEVVLTDLLEAGRLVKGPDGKLSSVNDPKYYKASSREEWWRMREVARFVDADLQRLSLASMDQVKDFEGRRGSFGVIAVRRDQLPALFEKINEVIRDFGAFSVSDAEEVVGWTANFFVLKGAGGWITETSD